ncbi:bifunctional bis(5'-adenosyl)-triphosphatase/adenylylsulfatase FHIT isoform X3 [Morus notabilis]|uniref:bifunctional bis(5'-adenosyl)-triphosphatase/adenylylsulfatase FHIT isoform X3 n=1 Tax=Morus notabilis TaxID=981085 RepID=UPI000CED5FD3|nr:bifunctional bis(5'-adenosyl)-triphosphatase/adenylylsulfatase FHIT isoform X3 [Morus notabilis]
MLKHPALLRLPSLAPQIGRISTPSSFGLRRISAAKFTTTTFNSHFSTVQMAVENYTFGPYKIDSKEVFYSTQLSYAAVNLRPLLPGHVLVCPRREVKRFVDLTAEETSDLWITAQKDGPQAGQTVPHVHIHIIPRKAGDFEKNDEIYDAIDDSEKEMKQKLELDKERKDRSLEEMAHEADEYRKLFV